MLYLDSVICFSFCKICAVKRSSSTLIYILFLAENDNYNSHVEIIVVFFLELVKI